MALNIPIRNVLQPLFKATFFLDRTVGRLLESKRGMRMAQFRILIALMEQPGLSQRQIADFWRMSEASASRQITLLIDKGLIHELEGSGRGKRMALTTKGQREVQECLSAVDRELEIRFEHIEALDRKQLIDRLGDILSSVKQEL